jgi:CBS domain-containing protein
MSDDLHPPPSTIDISIPEELQEKKTSLELGEKPRATVRELLRWFGSARRGYHVVNRIRGALDHLGLITYPDFEGEYIDQQIFFMVQAKEPVPATVVPPEGNELPPAIVGIPPAVIPPAFETPTESLVPTPTTPQPVDPSHRLGRLKAANRTPVSVPPQASLTVACTLMLSHDYSQLPVMQGDRNVKGLVSWKSIGRKLAFGQEATSVQECMVSHHELREDASLFEAIAVIAIHDCVLVRDRENRITGVVTGADISEQFHVLAEPFLLLGDIENRIRSLIQRCFNRDELAGARVPTDTERIVEDVSDLTFGEYVRLLESPVNWEKFGPHIDRAEFIKQLGRIRDIRNDVMHFDPDGITEEALTDLRRFSRFLDQLQTLQS